MTTYKETWKLIKNNPKTALTVLGLDMLMTVCFLLIGFLFSSILNVNSFESIQNYAAGPLLVLLLVMSVFYLFLVVLILSFFQMHSIKRVALLSQKNSSISFGSFYLANLIVSFIAIATFLVLSFVIVEVRDVFRIPLAIVLGILFFISFYALFNIMNARVIHDKSHFEILKNSLKQLSSFKAYAGILGFSSLVISGYLLLTYITSLILGKTVINETNIEAANFAFTNIFYSILFIILYLLFLFNKFYFFLRVLNEK